MALTSSDCGCGTEWDGTYSRCENCFKKIEAQRDALLRAVKQAEDMMTNSNHGKGGSVLRMLREAIALCEEGENLDRPTETSQA